MMTKPFRKHPSRILRALVLGGTIALLAACQSGPAAKADAPAAQSPSKNTAAKAASASPFVTDAAGNTWPRTPSGALNYAEALAYCRDLPAHEGKTAWRLPSFYQLARAPLAELGLAPDTRLWTGTAPERLPLERMVVDPANPFVKTGVDLRTNPKFNTLCIAVSP